MLKSDFKWITLCDYEEDLEIFGCNFTVAIWETKVSMAENGFCSLGSLLLCNPLGFSSSLDNCDWFIVIDYSVAHVMPLRYSLNIEIINNSSKTARNFISSKNITLSVVVKANAKRTFNDSILTTTPPVVTIIAAQVPNKQIGELSHGNQIPWLVAEEEQLWVIKGN